MAIKRYFTLTRFSKTGAAPSNAIQDTIFFLDGGFLSLYRVYSQHQQGNVRIQDNTSGCLSSPGHHWSVFVLQRILCNGTIVSKTCLILSLVNIDNREKRNCCKLKRWIRDVDWRFKRAESQNSIAPLAGLRIHRLYSLQKGNTHPSKIKKRLVGYDLQLINLCRLFNDKS